MYEKMYAVFIAGDLDIYKKWIQSLDKTNLVLYGIYLDTCTKQADIFGHFLRYAT